MSKFIENTDTVGASRDGHTFHERWAARRALQLIFPKDKLHAIAVEGLSSNETVKAGKAAEEIADLVLYFGNGDTFQTCSALQTVQFKYRADDTPVTASYLKKTIQKFAETLKGYSEGVPDHQVDAKVSFSFVTNTNFTDHLWQAIEALKSNSIPKTAQAKTQLKNLNLWCTEKGVGAARLFALTEFRAGTHDLAAQIKMLRRTVSDWSAGVDTRAKSRLYGLTELVREKAGLAGHSNNLITREDVLESLDCDSEDLFPADTRFIDVGEVVLRRELNDVADLLTKASMPIFIHAEGGVGKTVFIQSLAGHLSDQFEVVVFDCFGGGAYRSDEHGRHLPKIGLLQIINELASRGLCDPLLPTDSDRYGLTKAARKRLGQAASTLTEQAQKSGLLIIIDAADNAQLEADLRHEDSFPKLLLSALSREPIDGVKLLLTARPHRRNDVIGTSQVEPFLLGPFSDEESIDFLKSRRTEVSSIELSTALARSRGNARVLDYLVKTWDQNILGQKSSDPITVEEIIRQQCDKIFSDLHIVGWSDSDVKEFFAAISLLPPPVPLDELAAALGWSIPQVNSAASDLAPMLEVTAQGAIFRDEPTETYIRETYSKDEAAQRSIAERLLNCQSTSMYAAESLPRLLVAIDDSDRAFELARSDTFPSTVQSDYGRRRLKHARLVAAYTLATKNRDFDRLVQLCMELAHLASANARGDQFIRRSPGLAVVLGDRDVSRRLFNDRSGWRGARNARLTTAHNFMEELDEARIHAGRTIGWINWFVNNRSDHGFDDRSGPEASDYTSIIFLNVLDGNFALADQNLASQSPRFAMEVSRCLLRLVNQHVALFGSGLRDQLVSFAAAKSCRCTALQLALLADGWDLSGTQLRDVTRALSPRIETDFHLNQNNFDFERKVERNLNSAAVCALLFNSKQSARRILRVAKTSGPSLYDYAERHGPSRAWTPALFACLRAWSKGEELCHHHLLPDNLSRKRGAKKIDSSRSLQEFLKGIKDARNQGVQTGSAERRTNRAYSDQDCGVISSAIELILALVKPLQHALLKQSPPSSSDVKGFLEVWQTRLRSNATYGYDSASGSHTRAVGLGIAKIMLRYARKIERDDAIVLLEIIAQPKFTIQDRLDVFRLLTLRPEIHDLAGEFAAKIADNIDTDESIEQRGANYLHLASALTNMGEDEARTYYRRGLAQLDKMGGDDYELVYSLLHYANKQAGGFLEPHASQRLMNLCHIIFQYEPAKFGWTLFGRAAANAIGPPALYKLIRWNDQDVAEYSYGLPQLACYVSKLGHLDARRAAIFLCLCTDHGWHEWQVGEGLKDILGAAKPQWREPIANAVVQKLLSEHVTGAWPSVWESLLELESVFPKCLPSALRVVLEEKGRLAQQLRDEENRRNNYNQSTQSIFSRQGIDQDEHVKDHRLHAIMAGCDVTSAQSIDQALALIDDLVDAPFGSRRRFFDSLRSSCSYPHRVDFTRALCEASRLDFDDTIDQLQENFQAWQSSSGYFTSSAHEIIKQLFAFKGSELFQLRYKNIARVIGQLHELCEDRALITNLVLDTIAKEHIELDGDEWLQVATCLCDSAKPAATLKALNDLLNGPAAQVADQIGEGLFDPEFACASDQVEWGADIVWHLLGHSDSFLRWSAARSIKTFVDLGLFEDISALFDRFDRRTISGLVIQDQNFSFQNAQQWFLMGLARATLHHPQDLSYVRPQLQNLAKRNDIHFLHKWHIARCLNHLATSKTERKEVSELKSRLTEPPIGYADHQERSVRPKKAKTSFSFDHDYLKYEVSNLARVFDVSESEVRDLMAKEIVRLWPDATDMDYFPGHARYRADTDDRYETFREHVQRHAMLHAATSLFESKPVVRHSYDADDSEPWLEWVKKQDVTFDDGSWLSDHKNEMPPQSLESFLGPRIDRKDTLQPREVLLQRVGMMRSSPDTDIPIYGHWESSDSVHVRISSALVKERGAISKCKSFALAEEHHLWLPLLGSDGYVDTFTRGSMFTPWIWAPDRYPIGIDQGDRWATQGAINRPRLGIATTGQFELACDQIEMHKWLTPHGDVVLQSQVWGRWENSQDRHQCQVHNDGEILWASPDWLNTILEDKNLALVYLVSFEKYRSYRHYDDSAGVKTRYVCLRLKDGTLRLWNTKQNSSKK